MLSSPNAYPICFNANLPQLIELFQQHSLIELSRDAMTVHQ